MSDVYDIDDFLTDLTDYYDYISETKMKVIAEWVQGRGIKDLVLRKLFKTITEQFQAKWKGKVLELADIKDIYMDMPKDSGTIDPTESMDVRDILEKLIKIRKQIDAGGWDHLLLEKKQFYYKWSDIWSEFGICKDLELKPEEMRFHLEKVKQSIIEKRSVLSICEIRRVSRNVEEVFDANAIKRVR